MSTDDLPRWRLTRTAAYRNTCPVPAGYEFAGDPAAQGFSFGSYEPLNAAARRFLSGFVRAPQRPKWVAAKQTVVNNRVVKAGAEFSSDRWPDDDNWIPVNDPAREVHWYYGHKRADARLPRLAWPPRTSPITHVKPK